MIRTYAFHGRWAEAQRGASGSNKAGANCQLTWSGMLACAVGGSSAWRGPLEDPSGAQGGRARETEAAPCARAQSPSPAPDPS